LRDGRDVRLTREKEETDNTDYAER
jgi:hypothetical protein